MANDLVVFEKGALVNYDAAIHYLTESHKVDEVKNFRDQVKAIEAICKVANNLEMERLAREIRIRAEKKAGRLLKEREMAKGTLKRGTELPRSADTTTETLADLGITKNQSSTWQQLDDVPEEVFEEMVTTTQVPSAKGIINAHKPEEVPQIDEDSLRIWGKVNAFEYQKDESLDLVDLFQGMTDPMKNQVKLVVPRVIKFWQSFMDENNL